MAKAIDFYFDFYSPYGYLASLRIDEIASRHSREVNWRPILLGPAFKATGHQPLLDTPLMGDYVKRDFARSAKLDGVAITFPKAFPKAALAPSRAFYWVAQTDADKAKALARAVYQAIFDRGEDGTDIGRVAELGATLGIDPEALGQAVQDPQIKALFMKENQASLDRGVFGSPFVIVDDEPFWGNDRLDQVDQWLKTGGW